ncbi:hypothetical protein Tco_0009201 [Tanacetum coccineum]
MVTVVEWSRGEELMTMVERVATSGWWCWRSWWRCGGCGLPRRWRWQDDGDGLEMRVVVGSGGGRRLEWWTEVGRIWRRRRRKREEEMYVCVGFDIMK